MGRVCENGAIFFTKEEYAELKYQHLPRTEYRKFIDRIHGRVAEEEILNKEGHKLPFNMGYIMIQKLFKPNGIFAAYKGKLKEYNFHSMGFVYLINFFKNQSKVLKYSDTYKKVGGKAGTNPNVDLDLFKFTAHRKNIRRPLSKIIKNHKRDYPNAKDNSN
jgi:hypothetical protein